MNIKFVSVSFLFGMHILQQKHAEGVTLIFINFCFLSNFAYIYNYIKTVKIFSQSINKFHVKIYKNGILFRHLTYAFTNTLIVAVC